MILVKAKVELDYQVKVVPSNGVIVVTFPNFSELEPLGFPDNTPEATIRLEATRAVEDAVYKRLYFGNPLPQPLDKHSLKRYS